MTPPIARYVNSPFTIHYLLFQGDDGGSPATGFGRGVLEGENEGRAGQHSAHHFALHSDSAPMDDAQGFQAQAVGLFEIRLNRFLHILGPYGVQVENISDRNAQWFVVLVHSAFRQGGRSVG